MAVFVFSIPPASFHTPDFALLFQTDVNALTGNLRKIAVIHGEENQALAFAETLRDLKPKAEVLAPTYQQMWELE